MTVFSVFLVSNKSHIRQFVVRPVRHPPFLCIPYSFLTLPYLITYNLLTLPYLITYIRTVTYLRAGVSYA